MSITGEPAIEGWFEDAADGPRLLGSRCPGCATVRFPPGEAPCPNPACRGRTSEVVPLSRTGAVWSYTDARYQPPPPYLPASDPFEPFAIVAVELADERIVVLGQVAQGYGVDDLAIGAPVELVLEVLHVVDGTPQLIWRWLPTGSSGRRGGVGS